MDDYSHSDTAWISVGVDVGAVLAWALGPEVGMPIDLLLSVVGTISSQFTSVSLSTVKYDAPLGDPVSLDIAVGNQAYTLSSGQIGYIPLMFGEAWSDVDGGKGFIKKEHLLVFHDSLLCMHLSPRLFFFPFPCLLPYPLPLPSFSSFTLFSAFSSLSFPGLSPGPVSGYSIGEGKVRGGGGGKASRLSSKKPIEEFTISAIALPSDVWMRTRLGRSGG